MCPDVSLIFSFFVVNSGSQEITVRSAVVTVNTRRIVSILPSETDPLSPSVQTGFVGIFPNIPVCTFLDRTLLVEFDVEARTLADEVCTAQANVTYIFRPSQTEIEANQLEETTTTTLPPSIAPSPRTSTLESPLTPTSAQITTTFPTPTPKITFAPSPWRTNQIPTSTPDLVVVGQPCSLKVCTNEC
jgi:hypothetical protein